MDVECTPPSTRNTKEHQVFTIPDGVVTQIGHVPGAFGHFLILEDNSVDWAIGSDEALVTAGQGVPLPAGAFWSEPERVVGPWFVLQSSGGPVTLIHTYLVDRING